MADKALDTLKGQMSPDNQKWVDQLPQERQQELLKEWQDQGGDTELGNVGTDQKSIDADVLAERFRNS